MEKVKKALKKVRPKHVLLVLVIVLAVSCILVSNIFARYTSSSNGTGTVSVANWSFDATVDKNSSTMQIDLASTKDPNEFVGADFIAPGTAGYVPVFIDASDSDVALVVDISATFGSDFPSYIVFTDNMGRTLTKTTVGNDTVISYSYYFSVNELAAWDAAESDSAHNYVDFGFRWSWPINEGAGYENNQPVSFAITTTGLQVTSLTEIVGKTAVNFVTEASDVSTAASVKNVLLSNIDAITIADFSNDFELDLNSFAVGGDSSITTDSAVTIYLGTTRQYNANAGSFNNLTVTTPNATVFQSANLVGNVTVSSGSSSYYFSGKFVESAASTIEVSPNVVASGTAGKITVKGGRLVVKQAAVARTVKPNIVIAQTTAEVEAKASTKPVAIVVEKEAAVATITLTSIADTTATKAVSITNDGAVETISNEIESLTNNTPKIAVTNNGTVTTIANETSAEVSLAIVNEGSVAALTNSAEATASTITVENTGVVETVENNAIIESGSSTVITVTDNTPESTDKSYKVANETQMQSVLAALDNNADSAKIVLTDDLHASECTEFVRTNFAVDINEFKAGVFTNIVYLDMWSFWSMEGMVDASGNECPQYVKITDETQYRNTAVNEGEDEAWVSAKYLYENHVSYSANGNTIDWAKFDCLSAINTNYGTLVVDKNITLDMNDHSFDSYFGAENDPSGSGFNILEGVDIVIENGHFITTHPSGSWKLLRAEGNNVITFRNCTFTETSFTTDSVQLLFGTTVVFENCTFTNAQVVFEGMSGEAAAFDITFKDCTFNCSTESDENGASAIEFDYNTSGTVLFDGCSITMASGGNGTYAISFNGNSSMGEDLVLAVTFKDCSIATTLGTTPYSVSSAAYTTVTFNGTNTMTKDGASWSPEA